MPTARITRVAEALRDKLNGEEFSQAFAAEVRFRREKRLEELGELDVGVFRFGEGPTPEEDDSGDRSGDEIEYSIEIAVRKKVRTDEETEELIVLCEEIREYCSRLYLGSVDASSGGASYDPIHDEEHLQKGIFFGLVTVMFRGFEQ